MRSLAYKASLRKGFLRVLRYTVVRIIPPMLHKHLNLQIHSQKATQANLKKPGIKVVLLLKPSAFVKETYFQRFMLQTSKADYVFTCLLTNVLYRITSQTERQYCQYSTQDLPHNGPVALLFRILAISSRRRRSHHHHHHLPWIRSFDLFGIDALPSFPPIVTTLSWWACGPQ